MTDHYRQCQLSQQVPSGVKKTVLWLNDRPDLKVGVIVVLKGDGTEWTADSVSESCLRKQDILTDWKVGGL